MAWGVVACLALVPLGILLFVHALDDDLSDRGLVVGPLVAIGGASIIVAVLFARVRQGPAGLRVDAAGFELTGSLLSAGHIPWSDVTGWTVVEIFGGHQYLCVSVIDPEEVINRQRSSLLRRYVRANERRFGTPVSIGASSFEGGVEAVLDAFDHYSAIHDAEDEEHPV